MWKIQIFIFVEAIVLLFWQTKSEFSINRAECAIVFYRDAESFCDCSHFICGGLWFIDCLPLYV